MIRRSFQDWKIMMQKKRATVKLEALRLKELAEEQSLSAYSDAANLLYNYGCIEIDAKIRESQEVHNQRTKRHLDKAVMDIFKRVVLESDGNITCDDLRDYMRNAIIIPDNEDDNNEKI